MLISLNGPQRERFRKDLQRHRDTFSLNDADYSARVLKISLNTLKRCLLPKAQNPLTLKRSTFISVFANAELDPKRYGLIAALPAQGSEFGGYQKKDYDFLCGRHFIYRRSFLTAKNINRCILEISVNDMKECLSFREAQHYVSDSGVRDEQHYSGDIYMNRERSILSLPAYFEGQVRLTSIHIRKSHRRRTVEDARRLADVWGAQRLLATYGRLCLHRGAYRYEAWEFEGLVPDHQRRR